MSKVLIISLFFVPFLAVAQTTPSPEIEYLSYSQVMYASSGVKKYKISFKDFDNGLREFLHAKTKKEGIRKSVMTLVNFNRKSGKKRLVVVDLSLTNTKVWKATMVAHGKGSGGFWEAKKFSNKSKSHMSSLGAFVTSTSTRDSRFNVAMDFRGITKGLNDNAYNRLIKYHEARYVNKWFGVLTGGNGMTAGCLGVPMSSAKPFREKMIGGSLIYAFHDSYPLKRLSIGQEQLLILKSLSPSSISKPFVADNVDTIAQSQTFESLPPSKLSQRGFFKNPKFSLTRLASIFALTYTAKSLIPSRREKGSKVKAKKFEQDRVTVSHQNKSKYTGSATYENCQEIASEDLGAISRKVQKEKRNPYDFFEGSWRDFEMVLNTPLGVDTHKIPTVSADHLQLIRKCVALVSIVEPSNFSSSEPNQKKVIRSKDNKLDCQYQGSEGTDYHTCKELVKKQNHFEMMRKKLAISQDESYRKKVDSTKKEISSDINIQSSAHLIQEKYKNLNFDMVGSSKEFQERKLASFSSTLKNLSSYSSLLRKCKTTLSRYPGGGIPKYTEFNRIMSGNLSKSISEVGGLGDPCYEVLNNTEIQFTQNRHVRAQAEKILEEDGIEKERLLAELKIIDGNKGVKFTSPYGTGLQNSGIKGDTGPNGSDLESSNDFKISKTRKDHENASNKKLSIRSGSLSGSNPSSNTHDYTNSKLANSTEYSIKSISNSSKFKIQKMFSNNSLISGDEILENDKISKEQLDSFLNSNVITLKEYNSILKTKKSSKGGSDIDAYERAYSSQKSLGISLKKEDDLFRRISSRYKKALPKELFETPSSSISK